MPPHFRHQRLNRSALPAHALFLALMLALSGDALAQRRKPNAAVGDMIIQSCFACHGPQGASVAPPMPTIAGQGEAFLHSALNAFRDGSRPSTIMGRLMKGYSDKEIAQMAALLSKLRYVGAEQKIDPAVFEAGRQAYLKACNKCHKDNGRESADGEYPIVGGQWLEYLQLSIAEIRSGKRPVDDKFAAKLRELTPAEADAVLHFFAGNK